MNHLEYYSDCVLPDKWTILTKELKPLCLGHLLVLSKLKNVLVVGGNIESPEKVISDILLFILVCSSRFATACQFVYSDSLIRHDKKFIEQYTTFLLSSSEVMEQYQQELSNYLQYHLSTPTIFRNEKVRDAEAEMNINAAFIACNRVAALKIGYKSDEIWDIPIKQLNYELLANGEQEGLLNFVSDDPEMDKIIEANKQFMSSLKK